MTLTALISMKAHAETVIFEDKFQGIETRMPDGSSKLYPDRRKWAFTLWPGIKWPDSYGDGTNWLEGNDESQTYVTPFLGKVKGTTLPLALRYDPFSIDSEGLHIKASRLTPEQMTVYKISGHRRFGSGMLLSRTSFKYGSIRVVAKMPNARGSWPAIWLLPAIPKWPPEIDILEAMAWGPHSTQIHSGLLTREEEKADFPSYSDWFDVGVDLSQKFHEYGLDWDKNTIKATFDGKTLWERPTPPSMQADMYVIINLAVGGKWAFNELNIRPIDGRSPERLAAGSDLIEGDYPAEMIVKSISVTQPAQ